MIGIASNSNPNETVKVLVVEDEYILAINLQESLQSLGYTVLDIADSAELAIEKATQLRPNLILMDIRLRGELDGIQAAEQIWLYLQIPVIYVTGHSDKSTVERATLTSPFGYILKPIKEKELYVAIQTALNRYNREQFLTSVLRGMGDGVIVVDTELHIKFINEVGEALTGWRWKEAKEKVLTEVVKFVDEQTLLPIKNPIIVAFEQQTIIYLGTQVLLVNKDGTTIPVADSATPLKDNNGVITGAVLVFRDDTRRRLTEERNLAAERAKQLEIQVAELERLNKLKEDFLITTSHEMRTPLSNIKMAISVLENILDRQGIFNSEESFTSEIVNRYLSIMRDQCEQELDLVDDLLYIRMIDSNTYPLELTAIELQSWLPHIVEGFEARIQQQQQILELRVSRDLPSLVSDLTSLTEIISELLNNACKYTPANEQIQITTQFVNITESVVNEDAKSDVSNNLEIPYFEITISNSGVEIPINEQSRIFDPFYRIVQNQTQERSQIFDRVYQIVQSDRRYYGNTGLGLSLVKKLVEYLQGTIEVNSSQGWTNFIVKLPVRILEE
ncbi:chemotaxis protein CheY [Nostoc linckia z18]|uniref:histidine kinase n=2 Tax=Nostoc linckia TaxID=92942 RepID=A0A9Q6ELU9_NOSLI|nr:ATP-binding protein [Nostoc linckia]PHK40849.1 chemotaxis protein CheY [Nostoc linckia z15]PHK47577.1 chemotaxis protein CheY [Nostoc linckia z16]PHJ61166.1 chemotaxis protein CheY [Nostoc linckia z1]PHJ62320.1 chemotaxis protein CheY [Nostoc linckia z3]PHJ69013.1 chemotaxis protein CheY [Nostoc linckia z2]